MTIIEETEPEWTLDELIALLVDAREKIPLEKRAVAKAAAGSHQGYGVFWVGYDEDES